MPLAMGSVPCSPLLHTPIADMAEGNDEEKHFYAALDALPNFDSPRSLNPPPTNGSNYRYTIDEEDWQWLATAVATKSQQEIAEFAAGEYEKIALDDPDLVRRAPHLAPPCTAGLRLVLPCWP